MYQGNYSLPNSTTLKINWRRPSRWVTNTNYWCNGYYLHRIDQAEHSSRSSLCLSTSMVNWLHRPSRNDSQVFAIQKRTCFRTRHSRQDKLFTPCTHYSVFLLWAKPAQDKAIHTEDNALQYNWGALTCILDGALKNFNHRRKSSRKNERCENWANILVARTHWPPPQVPQGLLPPHRADCEAGAYKP